MDGTEQTELKTPWFSFKGQSQLMLVVLVVLLAASGLWVALKTHDAAAQTKADEQTKAVKELAVEVKNQGKSLEAVIYVLTLPEEERKKLNLSKPEKLKEMQR